MVTDGEIGWMEFTLDQCLFHTEFHLTPFKSKHKHQRSRQNNRRFQYTPPPAPLPLALV